MKTLIKNKIAAIAAPMLLSVALLSGQAQAEIVPGFYEGKFPNFGFNAKVFVHKTGAANGVGLVFGTNEHGVTYGSVFKIAELRGGILSWTQQFRDGAGSLSAEPGQHATYAARTHRTYSGRNKILLRFDPTEFGKKLGCEESFEVKRKDDWYSVGFGGHAEYEGNSKAKGFISPTALNGNLVFNGESFGGDYELIPVLDPSLRLLKGESLDANKASGLREELDNLGVITALKKEKTLWWDKAYFFVVRPPTVSQITQDIEKAQAERPNHCLAPTAILKEK